MTAAKREILVPLDGSELAEKVLTHVAALARVEGTGQIGVTLLQSVPLPITAGVMAWSMAPPGMYWDGWQEELEQARKYLEDVAEDLRTYGLQVQTRVCEGEPAGEIIEYIREHPQVSLVALATHGRSGIGRWIFGSVAERVLHSVTVPLLMVRPEESDSVSPSEIEGAILQPHPYKKVVVPLDGSPFAEQALEHVKKLARATQATLVLVTAVRELNEMPLYMGEVGPGQWVDIWKEEEEQIRAYLLSKADELRREGFAVLTEVQHGEPASTILHVSEDAQADIIAMSTHGRSGVGRFWLGSVALKVVQGSRIPVLLVRAREHAQEAPEQEAQ